EAPRGRKLGNVAGGDPGAEIIAGVLGAYDCGRDVISPVVGELKWLRGAAPGRGDRPLPALSLGILVEVTQVRLVEVVPRGQRNPAILDGGSAEDGLTVAGREASDVDEPSDTVGPGTSRRERDSGRRGVADDGHRLGS